MKIEKIFEFLPFALPAWLMAGIFVVCVIILGFFISRLLQRVFSFASAKSKYIPIGKLLETSKEPVDYLIIVTLFSFFLSVVEMEKGVNSILVASKTALYAFGVLWLCFKLITTFSNVATERLREKNSSNLLNVIPLIRRMVKLTVFLLILLFVMQNYGVDVGALLAGLGIGGLAVALAGQKTLENLFGGISMFMDQPVKVGDFCKCGDVIGTIEDIGLRSTRIRTLDRTIVTIPNSTVSELKIESYAKRDRIKLYAKLGMRYESTSEQLKFLIDGITKILTDYPKTVEETPRVRFVGFGDFSLDLEVLAYLDCEDWADFLKSREEIYFDIMALVEKSGTDFAFPSQTIYVEK
jgi:MscS family membrane protein